ncbi:DUF397 domain-containing protein [Streptomyces sp. bgisy154]|uniref:DUF397 domain-containing protein n=1 Tax=Streptomyces sp. bgisy154 TaxID=3413794 RepID=UPI003D7082A2
MRRQRASSKGLGSGAATWIKSTHSGNDGGNCVEIAPAIPGVVPVRDSKNPGGPVLTVSRAAWVAFVARYGA